MTENKNKIMQAEIQEYIVKIIQDSNKRNYICHQQTTKIPLSLCEQLRKKFFLLIKRENKYNA